MSARLPSIMIGIDFYKKARNRKWIQDNGGEAVIVLQEVWIASSQEKDCKIRKDECAYLPFPLPIAPDKIKTILESAVAVGLLDEKGDFYFNSQIVEDHKNFERKQHNYKEARKKREDLPPETSEDPPRILPQSTNDSPRIIVKSESEQRTVNSECEDPKPPEIPDPIPTEVYHRQGACERVLGCRLVLLNDFEWSNALAEYMRFDLNRAWLERGVKKLQGEYEKKPHKIGNRHGPYSELIDWPLKRCVEEKTAGVNDKAAKARLKKAETPYAQNGTHAIGAKHNNYKSVITEEK